MSLGITRTEYNGYGNGDILELRRLALKPRASAYDLEKMRWSGISGFYHPDDINSTVPISCMKTNPNIYTIMPMVCKPNQAFLDEQERLGIKLTLPTDIFTPGTGTVIELVDQNGETTQIPVGDKQENLAPLVMLAGLAALLFMGG